MIFRDLRAFEPEEATSLQVIELTLAGSVSVTFRAANSSP